MVKRESKKRKTALLLVFVGAVLIVLLDILGKIYMLYWTQGGFDIAMHFLGGFYVAFVVSSLFLSPLIYKNVGFFDKDRLLKILFVVLLVGIIWEGWEYYVGLVSSSEPYHIDTSIDIVMDLLGAWAGYSFFRLIFNHD